MERPTSRKRARVIKNPFSRGTVKWSGAIGNAQSPRIYPGAVIPVDDIEDFFTTGSKWFLSPKKANEYYEKLFKNAVPLDPDLVDALLQHWFWVVESPNNELIVSIATDVIDKIYMEAVYRWIQNKKK